MRVWTGHIKDIGDTWGKPSVRFLGVFQSEFEAAKMVKDHCILGFDDLGWVSEWDVKSEQPLFNVTVFDKGKIPR